MKEFTAILMVCLAFLGCSSSIEGQTPDNEMGGAEAPDGGNGTVTGGSKSSGGNESKGGSGGTETGGTETGGTETGGTGGSTGGSETGGVGGSGGTPGVCEPGEKHCTGNDIEVCNAEGQWEASQTCPFVCFDDVANVQCIGSCEPGAQQCSEIGNAQTCDDLGSWVTSAACPNACSGGECVGSCEPGNTQCAGDDVQFCNEEGSWDPVDTCEFVCSGAGDCIGVCEPGEVDCMGDTSRTCNSQGQWESGSECPFLCSAGSCTGVCEPGAKKCSGDGTQTCNSSGVWGSVETCPEGPNETASCSGNGTCGASCDSGFDDCTGAAGCETNLSSLSNCGACGNACDPDPDNASPICTMFGCGFTCDEGWDDENGLPGDGCEMNVYTDPDNCGAAGNSCFGGECVMGSCEFPVEEIAVSSNGLIAMAVEGSYIYGASGTGDIFRVNKNGGTPQVLAAGGYFPRSSKAFAVEDGEIVLSSYCGGRDDCEADGIYVLDVAGGVPSKVSNKTPFTLDVEDGYIYWNTGVHDMRDLPLGSAVQFYRTSTSGGSDTDLGSSNSPNGTLAQVKVVGDSIYFVRLNGTCSVGVSCYTFDLVEYEVSSWSFSRLITESVRDGSNVPHYPAASGRYDPMPFSIKGDFLYWAAPTIHYDSFGEHASGSYLARVDLTSSNPHLNNELISTDAPSDNFVADGTSVYYEDNDALLGVSVLGGPTWEMTPNTGVGVLAQDSNNLYWATWTYDGSGDVFFLKVAK